MQAPARLRPQLAQMAERVVRELSREPVDPDLQQFLRQVQRTDRDLVWDPLDAKFGRINSMAG